MADQTVRPTHLAVFRRYNPGSKSLKSLDNVECVSTVFFGQDLCASVVYTGKFRATLGAEILVQR